MTDLATFQLSPADRQAGVASVVNLPDDSWIERWERIFCAPEVKSRLLNAMMFNLGFRRRTSTVGLPTHGLLLLSGPPGTGKTTLAHGLADRVARELRDRGLARAVRFVLIDPHVIPSELLGQSQRSVSRLFDRVLPDIAQDGTPVVVLIDEVEGLAVSRRATSSDTNPADVHRSTEAVLTGLDHVASALPNVAFVATTNFPEALDEAVLSRVDLVESLGPPGVDAIDAILRDTLREIEGGDAAREMPELDALARRCAELSMDARQVRKLVLRALFSGDMELAIGSRPIRAEDLARAFGGS